MSKDESDNELDQETFGCGVEDELEPSPLTDNQCDICRIKLNVPRVLSCLHVFCESCLETQLNASENDEITCYTCSHVTKMNGKSASTLLMAFVNANILDMEGVHSLSVICTSCKSEDVAVARCADCANFLCPSCNTAHQVMRCFENHRVLTLEELKESTLPIPIHKPVACSQHPNEIVKFFCNVCQLVACSECVTEHKAVDHTCDRVNDADKPVREELRSLVQKAKDRVAASEEASLAVSNSLTELQSQYDSARSLIDETFQSYKAILEKFRDDQLEELKRLHQERELSVMEANREIETMRPHVDMAIAFTNALLELGDSAELLSSHRVVRQRLTSLLSAPFEKDVDVRLQFETNLDKFTKAVEKYFGKMKTADPPKSESPPSLNPISPPPNALVFIDSAAKESRTSVSPLVSTAESTARSLLSSTISIPTSGIMSSGGGSPTSLKSCDSDLSASLSSPFTIHPGLDIVTPPMSQAQTPSSLTGLTMMGEYNLQQLASLELDVPAAQNNFNIADLLSGDLTNSHTINNIQALAKLNDAATNGSIADHHSSNILDAVPNNIGHYTSMSSLSSSSSSAMPHMNGYHGINGYPHHGINGLTGMNGPGLHHGIPGLSSSSSNSAVSTLSQMNSYPIPRQPTANSSNMTVRFKYGQLGCGKSQFNSPHGFCLGADEEVIVADTNNHRIQIFEKDGTFKYQFGSAGREEGQLWYPRKVALMKNCGKYVVCDRGNERSRMQIFTKNGHFVRKISIRYIDIVAGLAVTADGNIVAVDSVSPTVFILSEIGALIHWFDCADYMREPSDIAINGDEYYVCDFKGHCVVVFDKSGNFVRRIGQEGVTNFPNGIDVSDAGDVLVGDSHGNRFHVTVFNREGQVLIDVECPYVKVSRCCGLKLTSEGLIVTLAKNNHHVLILSTLFVQ